MSNKRQVFLSLYYRDTLFIGGNRQRFGHATYHWGILISPKSSKELDCYAFDISDRILLDPIRRVNLNPEGDWLFREKANINPERSGHLLRRVMIRKVPNKITYTEIHGLLEAISLPHKGTLPEQNYVT